MTTTRSAMSATTPRSCVIRMIAVPRRSRRSRITSRMPAWMVTSSAVVGSSAIRTLGEHATAMAIITRCLIPPESWCGYSSTRLAGAGMRTRSSSSTALAWAARRLMPSCCWSTSRICRPTVKAGLRLVMGSWKTTLTCLPRTDRSCFGLIVSSSVPSSRMLPWTRADVLGSSPGIDIAVTVLPQPDSPTTARISPAARSKDTPFTACTTPSSVSKRTVRSRTSSSAVTGPTWGRARRAGRHRAG